MKIFKTANYRKAFDMERYESEGMLGENANASELQGREPQWRTGKVFTQAPGFGPGKEVEEQRIITIRPEENEFMALKREGFDPRTSRIEII